MKLANTFSFNTIYPNAGLSNSIDDIAETIPDKDEKESYSIGEEGQTIVSQKGNIFAGVIILVIGLLLVSQI